MELNYVTHERNDVAYMLGAPVFRHIFQVSQLYQHAAGLLNESSGLAHQDRSFNLCFLVRYPTLTPREELVISHGSGNSARALRSIKTFAILV